MSRLDPVARVWGSVGSCIIGKLKAEKPVIFPAPKAFGASEGTYSYTDASRAVGGELLSVPPEDATELLLWSESKVAEVHVSLSVSGVNCELTVLKLLSLAWLGPRLVGR